MWEQYPAGMESMNRLILFMQNTKVIAHKELFMAKVTMEELSAPFFLMKENMSKKVGPEVEKDLTVSMHIVQLQIKLQCSRLNELICFFFMLSESSNEPGCYSR